ncbi:MAG: DUF1570 domain-containing protein [Planctomycetota bacterium]
MLIAVVAAALGSTITAPASGEEPISPELLDELAWSLAATPADDLEELICLASWASDVGLYAAAESLCRELLSRHPDLDPAYELLVKAAGQRPLSRESGSYYAAREALTGGFDEHETAHFVVLSQAEPRWTRRQAARLEQSWHEFNRHARQLGLRPLPLRHKLVCVLFQRRESFLQFARTHDQMNDTWSLGYYALPRDRVVLYNVEAEEEADEFAARRSAATLAHEAIHQFHYHTRVQNPYVQYPLWVCEGIATAFETDRANQAFGPMHEFEPRRTRFDWLVKSGSLIPLRDFVQLDSMPDQRRQTVHLVYNQSYGLVSWLSRHRALQLRGYFMLMRTEPPGRPSPERHLELFESVFGDVQQLERAWVRDEIDRIGPEDVAPSLRRRMRLSRRGTTIGRLVTAVVATGGIGEERPAASRIAGAGSSRDRSPVRNISLSSWSCQSCDCKEPSS